MKFWQSQIELRSEWNALILTRGKQRISATLPPKAGCGATPRAVGRHKAALSSALVGVITDKHKATLK